MKEDEGNKGGKKDHYHPLQLIAQLELCTTTTPPASLYTKQQAANSH